LVHYYYKEQKLDRKRETRRESFKREKERNTMEGEKKPRERGRDF